MAYAEVTLRSVSLEQDVKVDLILPEDRHETVRENKKYPVLYVLHGFKEDNSTWGRLSNLPLIVRDLPLIVCTVSGYNSFYSKYKYGTNILEWIADELPVKLANFLPISENREDTYIMGESMGGMGTMKLALARPEKYGHACVLSAGAWNYEEMQERFGKEQVTATYGSKEGFENSVDDVLHQALRVAKGSGPKPDFQFYCGTEDFACQGAKRTAEFLKTECPEIPLIHEEYWPGKHDFYFWNQATPKIMTHWGFDMAHIDAGV